MGQVVADTGHIGHAIGGIAEGYGLYYQCDLLRGGARTTGWIEEKGAKAGALVELKGEEGYWRVIKVYQPPIDRSWLTEKQRKDRRSLGSIKE